MTNSSPPGSSGILVIARAQDCPPSSCVLPLPRHGNMYVTTDDTFLQADLINRVDKPQEHDLRYISGSFAIGAWFSYASSRAISICKADKLTLYGVKLAFLGVYIGFSQK